VEAVLFIGLQASGKSTFCRDRFDNTHIRLNLDMLKTRHREQLLLNACLTAKQPFVIDNTNPTPADRNRYILPAKTHHFRVVGYYFDSPIADCEYRNQNRPSPQIVPLVGLRSTAKKLIRPTWSEGFDALYTVTPQRDRSFQIQEWLQ
jgi:predicted kinase